MIDATSCSSYRRSFPPRSPNVGRKSHLKDGVRILPLCCRTPRHQHREVKGLLRRGGTVCWWYIADYGAGRVVLLAIQTHVTLFWSKAEQNNALTSRSLQVVYRDVSTHATSSYSCQRKIKQDSASVCAVCSRRLHAAAAAAGKPGLQHLRHSASSVLFEYTCCLSVRSLHVCNKEKKTKQLSLRAHQRLSMPVCQ